MQITPHLYNEDGRVWDTFVAGHKDGTNYHQYGWRRVVEKSFGHRTMYLAATNRHNEICGVLPFVQMKSRLFGNFMVSLPFFNYGGLLVSDGSAAETLLNASRKMLSGTGVDQIEFRHVRRCADVEVTKMHKVTMLLDLKSSVEDQWNSLDGKVRNQVRKAEKAGLRTVSPLAHLLISVAIEESRGDPAAVGAAGELGAWQVKPTDWGTVPKDLHAQAGQAEKIIRALLNSCNGDRVQALAHYNGGTSPPGKSYRYAKRVLKRAKHLQVAVDYLPPENRSPLYDRQLAG